MNIGDLVYIVSSEQRRRYALVVDRKIDTYIPYAAPVFSRHNSCERKILLIKCMWTDTGETAWIDRKRLNHLS